MACMTMLPHHPLAPVALDAAASGTIVLARAPASRLLEVARPLSTRPRVLRTQVLGVLTTVVEGIVVAVASGISLMEAAAAKYRVKRGGVGPAAATAVVV